MAYPLLSFMQEVVKAQDQLDQQKLWFLADDSSYTQNLERKFFAYRWVNKDKLFANLSDFKLEDFDLCLDFVSIMRLHFFINDSYRSIWKEYQELCRFFVALGVRLNKSGISNYLKYLDPNDSYSLRVRALTLFRLLKDPKSEIEQKFQSVSDFLYQAIQKDPESLPKAISVLKEYLDRVFSLTRVTRDQRMVFINTHQFESWLAWRANPDVSQWLSSTLNPDIFKEVQQIIIDKQTQAKNVGEFINAVETDSELKEKFEILESELKILKTELDLQRDYYEEENKKLIAEIEQLRNASKTLLSLPVSQVISQDQISSLKEKRQYYQITIVWGSETANKAYKNLQKEKPDFLVPLWLERRQLELEWDYNSQQDRKFARKIQDLLLLEKSHFVLALQTDHESPFINLLQDPDIWQRITIIWERGEYNDNPIISWQKFSQEKFKIYLEKALEKYEREISDTNTLD